jgi:hypothetical protein
LARVYEGIVDRARKQEDFPAARKAGREVVALKEKLYGERHWQVTDARLELAHTECLARLDKQQRQRLAEATTESSIGKATIRQPRVAQLP